MSEILIETREIKDTLDAPLEKLAESLTRLNFINCNYSCSGHLFKQTIDYGSAPDGTYFYSDGYLSFEIFEDSRKKNFLSDLQKLTNKYDFASLNKDPLFRNINIFAIILNFEKTVRVKGSCERYLSENIALEKFKQFENFWDDFEKLCQKYLVTSEKLLKIKREIPEMTAGVIDGLKINT